MAPTISDPPITLPNVTGTRLLIKKLYQVMLEKSAGDFPTEVQKESGAPIRMKIPIGIKYMLAMQCSKPEATNAAIGGTTVKIRSTDVRAP